MHYSSLQLFCLSQTGGTLSKSKSPELLYRRLCHSIVQASRARPRKQRILNSAAFPSLAALEAGQPLPALRKPAAATTALITHHHHQTTTTERNEPPKQALKPSGGNMGLRPGIIYSLRCSRVSTL